MPLKVNLFVFALFADAISVERVGLYRCIEVFSANADGERLCLVAEVADGDNMLLLRCAPDHGVCLLFLLLAVAYHLAAELLNLALDCCQQLPSALLIFVTDRA